MTTYFMTLQDFPLYLFTFIALYTQVYLFIVIFEEWDTIFSSVKEKPLKIFPRVVVAVPCWNEEKTLHKSINSLLNLDYPKDKLRIVAVDDGSTDKTWEVLQKYKDNPNVKIFTKENGGKHTVLNFAIEQNKDWGEIFGCLDAESFVYPDTLKNMLKYFEDNKTMAVAPMMVVHKPKTVIQAMQSVEYNFGLFLKRIFSAINGIHVTPGPFSLFRFEVFERIGMYRPAHQTEDMEITFRMQKNFMKIVAATDAYVETTTPDTVYKLYRQRLRWTQGFMQNSLDYRDMIFRPRYGNIAMLTIPLGWLGITMVLYMAGFWIYTLVTKSILIYNNWQALGIDMFTLNFSWQTLLHNIYFETGVINILAIPVFISGLIFIFTGHSMSLSDSRRFRFIVYFIFMWEFLIPWWMARAAFNTLTKRSGSWR